MAAALGLAGAALAWPVRSQASGGWRIAGDFEPAARIWLGFDLGHADLSARLVRALQPHVPLRMLVRTPAEVALAREALASRGLGDAGLEFMVDPRASYFVRDAVLFARGDDGLLGVVDFVWSQYGLLGWCRARHAGEPGRIEDCAATADSPVDALAGALARRLDAQRQSSDLAFEGGGLEFNGEGLVLVSEAYLRQRNPGRSREDLERALLALPGVEKVIWLGEGLAEDAPLRATVIGHYVAWGTGGHTDEFVRFADPSTVLLAWPDPADAHPVARLNARRMRRNLRLLAAATDARGRPLRILRLPTPRVIERPVVLRDDVDPQWSDQWSPDYFPEREGRRVGQTLTQVAPASYLNFVVANGVVVVPDYAGHGTPKAVQARVEATLRAAFPGREIAFVDSLSTNWFGGGPHCATLNEPA